MTASDVSVDRVLQAVVFLGVFSSDLSILGGTKSDKSVGTERRKKGGVMTQMSAPGRQPGQREDTARVCSPQALRLGVERRAAPAADASARRTAASD